MLKSAASTFIGLILFAALIGAIVMWMGSSPAPTLDELKAEMRTACALTEYRHASCADYR